MTRITGHWFHDPETERVTRMLERAGYKALFVGGCVRNALLGAPVTDIDLSTDALPDKVMDLAAGEGLRALPTGIDHGTITVISGHIPHEITTFRKDVETDGRRAVVAYSTRVEDDAHRRDFTMNALYARSDGTVVDPIGGLADLVARRVRFIDNPDLRIREDYLRILRFFRFHAWYGCPESGMDADALAAIAANVEGLHKISRERMGAELKKLLAAPSPAEAVAAMRACGVLAHALPGADDRLLAPLVYLESGAGVGPDPIRRLAALGGEGVPDLLRLSNAETRRLRHVADSLGSTDSAAALGYKWGAEIATDAVLLRASLAAEPLAIDALSEVARGAHAVFPVRAADLPNLVGPDLGRALKSLETRWIASGFTMDRDELLG